MHDAARPDMSSAAKHRKVYALVMYAVQEISIMWLQISHRAKDHTRHVTRCVANTRSTTMTLQNWVQA